MPNTPTYDQLSALCAQMAAALEHARRKMAGNVYLSTEECVAGEFKPIVDALTAYRTLSPDPQWQRVPEELNRIESTVAECCSDGAAAGWQPCSGCHETNEGYSTGDYPFSKVFDCEQGAGCHECGGLGVIWFYYDKAALKEMAEEHPLNRARGEG